MSSQLKYFQAEVMLALYTILTTLLFGFGYGEAGIGGAVLAAIQFTKMIIASRRLEKTERELTEFYKQTLYMGTVSPENLKFIGYQPTGCLLDKKTLKPPKKG